MRTSSIVRVLAISSILMLMAVPGQAREPLKNPDDLVAVELATVGVDPFTGSPLVLLREPGSGDVVPISIGPAEARAILMAIQEVPTPRPMTHDLATDIIKNTGGRLERVLVDGLVENTYFGLLDIRMEDDEDTPVYVDSRPSDALALAVRAGAGILVAPDVLQATRDLEFEGLEDDQVVTALGITVTEVTDELREALGLPDEDGLLVNRAVGEAEGAGIVAGAMILEINGETPTSPMDFLDRVRKIPDDEKARIRFWHEGEEQEAEISTDVPIPERRREQEREPGIEV